MRAILYQYQTGSSPGTLSCIIDVNCMSACVCARSGKNGKLTVRTQDEPDDVQTGSSPGTLSVLDVTFDTKFYVGGVVGQAMDTVSLSLCLIL